MARHTQATGSQTLFTVAQSSGHEFITDVGFLGGYFAFLVTNVASPAGFAYASVGDFVGGKIALAPSQSPVLSAGYLAPGSSKMVYAYFTAADSIDSTVNTNFSMKVWTFRPSTHADSGFAVKTAMDMAVKNSIRCEREAAREQCG